MKSYGSLDFEGGAPIKDLKIESGAAFPTGSDISLGSVFWLTSGATPGPHVYSGTAWKKLSLPSDLYVLPISSAIVLGGIRVGHGLIIDPINGDVRVTSNHVHGVVTLATGTTTIPLTTPTITNGTQFCSVAITTTSADSAVRIRVALQVGTNSTQGGVAITVWRNNTLIGGCGNSSHTHGTQNTQIVLVLNMDDENPLSNALNTYKFRIGGYNGATDWTLAQFIGGTWGGAAGAASSVLLEEVLH